MITFKRFINERAMAKKLFDDMGELAKYLETKWGEVKKVSVKNEIYFRHDGDVIGYWNIAASTGYGI